MAARPHTGGYEGPGPAIRRAGPHHQGRPPGPPIRAARSGPSTGLPPRRRRAIWTASDPRHRAICARAEKRRTRLTGHRSRTDNASGGTTRARTDRRFWRSHSPHDRFGASKSRANSGANWRERESAPRNHGLVPAGRTAGARGPQTMRALDHRGTGGTAPAGASPFSLRQAGCSTNGATGCSGAGSGVRVELRTHATAAPAAASSTTASPVRVTHTVATCRCLPSANLALPRRARTRTCGRTGVRPRRASTGRGWGEYPLTPR